MTKWFNTMREARAYAKKHGGVVLKGYYPYGVNPKPKSKRQSKRRKK